ncbi:YtzI protein [Gottfriedia solisilvae]|uniref:YtzI protein n=1 Tax=Gottfriedia solisilvae TaxID=1516104 RepID=A0A8J3AX49_9BACI|nr:YtzI protein [Gottfriedia solisilvae]GGI17883.1 hypothetical protein GCM10007380_40160 [Gottfriedia solisilvae]
MTGVYIVSGIIIFVVFGAFVITVNKGYGVKHKVDTLDEVKINKDFEDKQ